MTEILSASKTDEGRLKIVFGGKKEIIFPLYVFAKNGEIDKDFFEQWLTFKNPLGWEDAVEDSVIDGIIKQVKGKLA